MGKKFLGIFLVCCMIFSVFVPITHAAVRQITLSAEDIVENDGFYDNEAVGTETGNGLGSVILRYEEWLKYDISMLQKGTYEVSVRYALDGDGYKDYTYLDALTDGVLVSRKKLDDTASDTTFESVTLAKIYVADGTETFTLRNSSKKITPANVNGDYDADVDIESITFKFISDEDTSEICITSSGGQNILNTTSGSGFADSHSTDYNNNNVTSNNTYLKTTSLCMQAADDYGKYDISELKAGAYELELIAGVRVNGSKINVFVDETKVVSENVLIYDATTSGVLDDGTKTVNNLGQIMIGEDAEVLKFETALGQIYLGEFTLKYVGTEIAYSEKKINALSVYGGDITASGAGVGFYDGFKADGSLETESGKVVVLRDGKWLKYDVTGLKGTYKVWMYATGNNGGSITSVNYYVNDAETPKNNSVNISFTDAYVTYALCDLGTVKLVGGENQTLKIEFDVLAGVTKAEYFYLEKVEPIVPSELTVKALSVHGGDITASGAGVGFYDGFKADGSLETESGKFVVLRDGKWLKYDAPELNGTYKVSMYATGVNGVKLTGVKLYVNDAEKTLTNVTDITFSGYETTSLCDLGTVTFDGNDEQTIKIEFETLSGVVKVEYFYLEKIDARRDKVLVNSSEITDYYNLSTSQGFIRENTEFVINATEWLKFDVPALYGAYDVTMHASGGDTSAISAVKYTLDDGSVQDAQVSASFTDFNTYGDYSLGTVVFYGTKPQSLKIEFEMTGASYVKSFTFTPSEISSQEILAPNVSAGGEGVGFHDLTGSLSFMNGGADVTFSDTEWVKYDTPYLNGVYEVLIYASGSDGGKISGVTITANDETEFKYAPQHVFTGYGNYEERKLGYVSFEGDKYQSLKIQFRITGAVSAKKIILRKADSGLMISFANTSGATITEIGNNTALKTNVAIASGTERNVMVITAIYNGTKLESAIPEVKELKAGKVEFCGADVSVSEGQSVKVFVWSMDEDKITMIPEGSEGEIK